MLVVRAAALPAVLYWSMVLGTLLFQSFAPRYSQTTALFLIFWARAIRRLHPEGLSGLGVEAADPCHQKGWAQEPLESSWGSGHGLLGAAQVGVGNQSRPSFTACAVARVSICAQSG